MKNRKQDIIALLSVILLAGVIVIANSDNLITQKASAFISFGHDIREGNNQCQTYTPTGNYAHCNQSTGILVPMHSVSRGLHRVSPVYRPTQQSRAGQDNTYSSQGLVQLSDRTMHSYGTTAANSGVGIATNGAGSNSTTYTGASSYTGLSAYSVLAAKRKTTAPTLAYVSSYSSTASSSTPNSTIRRVAPSYDGGYNGETYTDSDGTTWTWSEEDGWVSTVAIGTTKIDNGNVYRWNGTSWEFVSNQLDPSAPLGDIPLLLLILFLTAYYLNKHRKRKAPKRITTTM